MTVVTSYKEEYSLARLASLATISVYIGILFSMICVPILNKCYWTGVVIFFLSGVWRQAWPPLLKTKIIINTLVLIALFTIAVFYSYGSWHFALRVWNKYLKLSYLLFFIPLFTTQKSRNYAIIAFLISIMISEVCAYIHFFNFYNFGFGPGKHWMFVQDIDAGYLVSFASFLFANIVLDNKKFRWLALTCLLICSVDMLLLNQERTGYLIFMASMCLLLCQRLKWKGFASTLILLPLFVGSLYLFSPKFNDRINQVVTNLTQYQQGNAGTSIGLRLAFAKYSFMVIKERPFFGSGTGSFEEIYKQLKGPMLDNSTWPAHPHNEYILNLFQLGIVGLIPFLTWLYLILHESFKLQQREQWYLQGLLLGFVLLGFCNASLLVNPAGGIFMTFLSVFLAANSKRLS